MKLGTVIVAVLCMAVTGWAQVNENEALQRQVEAQGKQIEELQRQLDRLETLLLANVSARPVQITSTEPRVALPAPAPQPVLNMLRVTPATTQTAAATAAQPLPQIAGFRLGGDFRYRFDAAIREASPLAGGLQNIRQRYRLRLNIDRDIASDLSFHGQLATGAVNNGITFDQDFAGGVTRHPFFISEAWIDYHPSANLSLRGGKLEEVFADNSRFLWDDDVRFNGFHERWKKGKVEFRAGQYLFVNPNVFTTPAGSALTLGGVTPGTIARAAQMFHQGVVVDNPISKRWRGQFTTDVQIYRNPSLIALTSNGNGTAATLNPAIGLTLSGAAPGAGNATVSSTSSILAARHYQVVRGVYKLDANQLGGSARWPFTWSLQVARNVGASKLRDAIMSTIGVGRTQEKGEVRALYAFAIKDANSLLSQLTDDDLGTGVGANIATHHFRLDYALRRGVVFQNLFFRQTGRRASNPADSFFVPLGRGTPPIWRYQGQLAISF